MRQPVQVAAFSEALVAAMPGVVVQPDPPAEDIGIWWFDITLDRVNTVVPWNPVAGFGIYPDDTGFGERPALLTPGMDVAVVSAVGQVRRKASATACPVL